MDLFSKAIPVAALLLVYGAATYASYLKVAIPWILRLKISWSRVGGGGGNGRRKQGPMQEGRGKEAVAWWRRG